jgi:hypothetical protein
MPNLHQGRPKDRTPSLEKKPVVIETIHSVLTDEPLNTQIGISNVVQQQNQIVTEAVAKTMQLQKRRDLLMQELDRHDCQGLFEIA